MKFEHIRITICYQYDVVHNLHAKHSILNENFQALAQKFETLKFFAYLL